MSKKVLYLVSMETTNNNHIHKNQVLPFVEYFDKPLVDLLFLSPLFLFSRKKKGLNKRVYKKTAFISEIRIPVLSFFGYMNWFVIPFYLLITLPILFFFIKKKKVKYNIIHARGYNSSILAFVYKIIFDRNLKIIFDPRSIYPEEGVIMGRWKINYISYKVWKKIEKILLIQSDAICCVSNGLVEHFNKIVYKTDKYYFRPAFVNNRFLFSKENREELRLKRGVGKDEVLGVYLGSLGQWHGVEELIILIKNLETKHKDNFKMIILSNVDKNMFESVLENVEVRTINPEEVPAYLSMCDYSFLPGKRENSLEYEKMNDTMISSKIQESLVSGLKIFVNKDINEVVELADIKQVGLVYDFVNMKVEKTKADMSYNRITISNYYYNLFSTEVGLNSYVSIYNKL